MDNIDVKVLLGVASLVFAVFAFWYANFKKRRRPQPRPIDDSSTLTISYFLLRADQIPCSGFWGRTMEKYVVLNFPENPGVRKKLDEYLTQGSVTHAAHALRALRALAEATGYTPSLKYDTIDRKLRSIRREGGVFDPSTVINTDEFTSTAHTLRHNSTAIACLHYLRGLLKSEAKKKEYRDWIECATTWVVKRDARGIWQVEPIYRHSLAYLIQGFDIALRTSDIPVELRSTLQAYIADGISTLMKRLESNFWLASAHPQAKCHYTLQILDILLQTPLFHGDAENLLISYNILKNLSAHRNQDAGLSLGALADKSKYSISDVGTTARFAYCLRSLRGTEEISQVLSADQLHQLEKWSRESDTFITNNLLSVRGAFYNSFTHSFESLLLYALQLTGNQNGDNAILRTLMAADAIVDEWQRSGKIKLSCLHDSSLPEPDFLRTVVVRDMIHRARPELAKLGFQNYWG